MVRVLPEFRQLSVRISPELPECRELSLAYTIRTVLRRKYRHEYVCQYKITGTPGHMAYRFLYRTSRVSPTSTSSYRSCGSTIVLTSWQSVSSVHFYDAIHVQFKEDYPYLQTCVRSKLRARRTLLGLSCLVGPVIALVVCP